MSEPQQPATEQISAEAPAAPPRWRALLLAALPHVLTALAAIGLTLLIQQTLPQPGPAFVPLTRPTLLPATAAPAPAPAPSAEAPPQPDARVIGQEIIDLQTRLDQVWSGLYIARAASQIADAEFALRGNDTAEVERVLVAVDASLALAYQRSDQLSKPPIGEFRAQLGQIRDDLHVRPESLDQRLRSLRQRMMSLVEEP